MMHKTDKYTYRIEWSEEDKAHVARCLEFPSLAAHGKTSEDALKEIEIAVSETIKWMEEEHELIPEPLGMKKFKGNITLRIPPELHRKAYVAAKQSGASLNAWIAETLTHSTEHVY